jgi:hypothetical protein
MDHLVFPYVFLILQHNNFRNLMDRVIKKLIFIFFLLFFCLNSGFVFALEIKNYPPVPFAQAPQDFVNTASPDELLTLYANYFLHLFITIAGIAAFAVLIWGGISYLLSSGNAGKIASAKDKISASLIGILILFTSVLILRAINPELTILNIKPIQRVETPAPPKIPIPKNQVNTSIEIEMPIGRIVENVLEMYIAKIPEPVNEKSRMVRIEDIIKSIKTSADNLKQQSEALQNNANKCSCNETKPETPCGGNKSGDVTWECGCGQCGITEPCNGDPCAKVRGNIQETENKNLTEITNIKNEQVKTEEEIRSLNGELNRLAKGEQFLNECPASALSSFVQILSREDVANNQKIELEQKKYWDDQSVVYNRPLTSSDLYKPGDGGTKRATNDYTSFYCSISGTVNLDNPFLNSTTPDLTGNENEDKAQEVLSQDTACGSEAPVGEIIDRTQRVAGLLIIKMNEITDWGKKLTEAVDNLQVLVSQCSSRRGCERRCTCFPCICRHSSHCREGCQGWAYGCADSSGAYPSACLERDEDTPCPYPEIKTKIEEINKIHQEIVDRIDGKGGKITAEEIGVIDLIEKVGSGIVIDLDSARRVMTTCESKESGNPNSFLAKCEQIPMSLGPKGETIGSCYQKGSNKPYGECLEECYLSVGLVKYRGCLQSCLTKKSTEVNDKTLPLIKNTLNFYCCETD